LGVGGAVGGPLLTLTLDGEVTVLVGEGRTEPVAVAAADVIELRTEGTLSTLDWIAGLLLTRVELSAATIGRNAELASGAGSYGALNISSTVGRVVFVVFTGADRAPTTKFINPRRA